MGGLREGDGHHDVRVYSALILWNLSVVCLALLCVHSSVHHWTAILYVVYLCYDVPTDMLLCSSTTNQLLTALNRKGISPQSIALACHGYPRIEQCFTIVVYKRYQLITPGRPLYVCVGMVVRFV